MSADEISLPGSASVEQAEIFLCCQQEKNAEVLMGQKNKNFSYGSKLKNRCT
jgi:hypothetical protein